MKNIRSIHAEIGRREALYLLGATTLIAACGGKVDDDGGAGGAGGSTSSATTAATAASTSSGSCAATPEGEIGPYFADDSDAGFNRSNILSNIDGTSTQTGVPLTLTIYVVDSGSGCAPYADAQVDIWHCNAAGVYSDESSEGTDGESWLRGYQLTDSDGKVTFTTILPGWYEGRTTHIHLRVRSSYSSASSTSDGTNTTQVFFPQDLVDTLESSVAPYDSEGVNSTTNASDHVYTGETDGETLMTLFGSAGAGYTATFTVVLPIG